MSQHVELDCQVRFKVQTGDAWREDVTLSVERWGHGETPGWSGENYFALPADDAERLGKMLITEAQIARRNNLSYRRGPR